MDSVNSEINVAPQDLKILRKLLDKHLPGTAVWIYGSRVKSISTPKSDLDVVVFSTPKQRLQVSNLREEFDESDLPFQIDLFVWDDVPEAFKMRIKSEAVILVEGKS